jgi:hypothetical protein
MGSRRFSSMSRAATLRILLLAVLAVAIGSSGCSKRAELVPEPAPADGKPAPASNGPGAEAQQAISDATTRRVIHTAELSLDADVPEAVESKLGILAETKGGFVVSSETARARDSDGAELVTVSVVFRVPAAAFDATLASVRALGTRVSNERITGQDVTEEYVDLEARIKAQRAIEEQYLSVLKDAKTIPDVLAVQQKLGEVRTEIERAEGRRRFLENQTSLSTITVHVSRHFEAVDTRGPGFGRSVVQACHDAVTVAIAIVNGAIRAVGILLPIAVLIVAPIWLVVRAVIRRRRRRGHALPGGIS